MATRIRCRTEPLDASDLKALAWMLPPISVLVLAHLVFDLVAGAYGVLSRELIDRASLEAGGAAILQVGFAWYTAALVYLVSAVGCLVGSFRILASRVRAAAARPFRRLALAIVVLGLGHLALVEVRGLPLRAIFDVTMHGLETLDVLGPMALVGVNVVVGAINLLSVVVPTLLVTAAAATALRPIEGWDEESLVRRSRQVKEVVAMAATFMVAGVLHMGAWTHWADAMLPGGELGRLASGVTLYWGAAFTLMIAGFYLPMATVLRGLAEAELDQQGVGLGVRAAWLADRGLSFQVGQQLPQIAAMAAPMLAGPLSEAARAGVTSLGI